MRKTQILTKRRRDGSRVHCSRGSGLSTALSINPQENEPFSANLSRAAIGYVTPQDMLAGRQAEIHAQRDRKLEEARNQREIRRRKAA